MDVRTGGSSGTETGEVVEVVDTRSSVLTRLIITLVYLAFTQPSRVSGLTLTPVVISSIDTRAVNTHHADTVVPVHFTPSPAESYTPSQSDTITFL